MSVTLKPVNELIYFTGTKCSDDCSWDYDPHCATDGKTYQNLCRLNFAKCISGGLFTLIRRKSYIGKGQCVKSESVGLLENLGMYNF